MEDILNRILEIGSDDEKWTEFSQDRVKWRADLYLPA
jgi:hypothetical protein